MIHMSVSTFVAQVVERGQQLSFLLLGDSVAGRDNLLRLASLGRLRDKRWQLKKTKNSRRADMSATQHCDTEIIDY